MAWGQIAAAVAPVVASSLLSGKRKTSQVPLEPPEVTEARRRLLGFADTGTFGGFTAGQEQNLGYGDYGTTGVEQTGMSELERLLASGTPEGFNMGNNALRDILNPDQNFIQSQFDPFRAQVERGIAQSNRDLTRNAGFAGNLYSTDTIRNLGDIEARGNETLTSRLAELTNQAMERRLQAVPLAFRGAEGQEAVTQGRIGTAFDRGGLTRQLNDASIKARDAEILRRRTELQLPIQAAQTVAGSQSNYGVPSVTTNPLDTLLNMAGQIGGNYLGNELTQRQYRRNFPTTRN
jgi:hypothetical protein